MSRFLKTILFIGVAVLLPRSFAYPQQLAIHTIDVGQGASELVIGPDGTSVLIDGGTSSKGTSEVLPYLNAIFPPGSRHLDYVIASHDHNDHYGGLNSVLSRGYTAGTIYHCGDNSGFGKGVQIPLGQVIDLGDGATITCVGRYGEFIDGSSGGTGDNNVSVCLLIEYGNFDYVTAGDLESNENYLSNALITYPPGSPYLDPAYGAEAIHVNHHGSDTSSRYYYVNRLKPELAVINGGTSYGHPRWTAVDRLRGEPFYTISCACDPGACGDPTNVTWSGAAVFRTTAQSGDCERASEADCPTLGDMVITYNGCAPNYYLNGNPYPVDETSFCTTPTPTPPGYRTPTPSPTQPPSPTPSPTFTPTPSPTLTPESYHTPTPTPTVTPTPSATVSPPPTATPLAANVPFYDGFESGGIGENWSVFTTEEGRVRIGTGYPYAGTYSALLDDGYDGGPYSISALALTVDLSQQSDSAVNLEFWWREFNDENDPDDGVFISDDYGGSWSRVLSFNNGTQAYTHELISLSTMRSAYGLDFNEHFQIKFQFYDNYEIATDGYAIDEVELWVITPTPTPTPEGYESPTPTPTVTPTPYGFKSPTPTPSVPPTPTVTPSPSTTPTPPPVTLPFYDGFESGVLGQGWSTFTEAEGRVQVGSGYPYAGTYSALLDDSYNGGVYSTASLTLTVDLSGQSDREVNLEFWWREFNDENHSADGVFISDDDGGSWHQVLSFNYGPLYFTHELISLSAMKDYYGLDFNDHFRIKFQFYDNFGITTDGYAIDEVELWAAPTPTPTPYGYKTPTPTPSITPTVTPTPTPSSTPTPTPTPMLPGQDVPFTEDFEGAWSNGAPNLWTKEYISGANDWIRASGGQEGHPPSAYGGTYNARFHISDYSRPVTRLISPRLRFREKTNNPRLVFRHAMAEFTPDQDELSVYYRSAGSDPWTLLAAYDSSVPDWTRRELSLPDPSDDYFICFEGSANYGYGVCLDDVLVTGESSGDEETPLILDSGDYDGDGTDDIAIFRGTSGMWSVRGVTRVYYGSSADLPIPGDYNGDGTADIGIFRPGSGLWGVRGLTRVYFGSSSDIPIPGDYDGDGSCDVGIFRDFSGLWAVTGVTRAYFGSSGDLPVPGDYDGDGTREIALFRAASGMWAIVGMPRVYFGGSGDEIVPGDYNGDGAWEAAIFRPASGMWAVTGVTRAYYGSSSDQPVPADYNGDFKDDMGIFRPSSGLWGIRNISRAYFGRSDDLPVTR